jgi:hypothetical protein
VTELPERWVLHGESIIARSVRYEPEKLFTYQSNWNNGLPTATSNQDMRGAMTPFFFDQNGTQHSTNRNVSQADFPLSCPTSRCEWSPYQTLGVCSACADVSHLLTYACLPMTLDWIRNATGPGTEDTYLNGKHNCSRWFLPAKRLPFP